MNIAKLPELVRKHSAQRAATVVTERDRSQSSEDRRPERPRSPCAGTTDTHTFAEYNSAIHGNFGQSTSACRIDNKTEQKKVAGFPFVRPFEPPAAAANSTRAGPEDAMGLGCG